MLLERTGPLPCVTCRNVNITDIFHEGDERCVQGFGGETAWKIGSR